MFKRVFCSLLAFSLFLTGMGLELTPITAAEEKQTLNIAVVTGDEENDLYVTLKDNYNGIQLCSTLDEAISLNTDGTDENDVTGIMVLADNYPNTTTEVTTEQAEAIKASNVRLYIEYPSVNETLGISGYDGTVLMNGYENGTRQYNRGIITNADAMGMENHSLLYAQGARLAKKSLTPSSIESDTYWMVGSRVAGYDVAEFGITEATYSLIEVTDDVMIASTKFSQFISARYAPYERYQQFWKSILSWVSGVEVTSIEWEPLMTTAYGPTDEVDVEDYLAAVEANTEWYIDSGMVLSETDNYVYVNNKSSVIEDDETGENNLTNNGTGIYGILEAFSSGWGFNEDGSQKVRFVRRADCNGESAGNIALAGILLDNEKYTDIAYNVVNWLLTESIMSQGNRANPESPEYGLLSWDDRSSITIDAYYGDDNAKAILGLITATSALRSTGNYDEEKLDAFDKRILEAIIANFRTTSTTGMRVSRINGWELRSNGWEYYYNGSYTRYSPHFEALNMATYIWAYDKTGYEPLLERAKTGIENLMNAYYNNEWKWTNGMQQERAKMLLPLAWLVRVEDTEQHKAWLDDMVEDMMSYQDEETGALRDAFGEPGEGTGVYGPFTANSQYGNHESPVIQENGDPCVDALYTASFAMMSLNEAYAAATDEALKAKYKQYSDSLADFFVKCQTTSTNEDYNGVWFRGFDYEKWEVYGSDGDTAWGVWATETGWSQAWISNSLSMKAMNTNIWDYTQNSVVDEYFEETARVMLNYDPNDLTESITVTPLGRGSVDVLTDKEYGTTDHDDGNWIGTEGQDVTITIDFAEEKTFDGISVGFISNMVSGICPAASVTYYISEDGENYEEVGSITITEDAQALYDSNEEAKVIRPLCDFKEEVSARYVKAIVKNAGNYKKTNATTETKTWIFMDELELNITQATISDLYEMLAVTRPLTTGIYINGTGEALERARSDAETVYAKENATASEIQNAYVTLKTAYDNLEQKMKVVSMTTSKNGKAKEQLIDGIYSPTGNDTDAEYISWQNVKTIEVVLDMLSETNIDSVGYSVNSKPQASIYIPNATIYVSNDQSTWEEVGSITAETHPYANNVAYASKSYLLLENIEARYVKFVFTTDKEWVFMDEVMVNVEESELLPTLKTQLQNMFDEISAISLDQYASDVVDTVENALEEVEVILQDSEATFDEVNNALDNLKAVQALLEEEANIVESVTYGTTPSRDWESSWDKLVDGVYGTGTSIDENAYVAWKQDDVEVIIKLKEEKFIESLGYSGVTNAKSGVYNPNATYYVSMDGTTWIKVAEITGAAPSGTQSAAKESASVILDNAVGAKYIKVEFDRYRNNGNVGEWYFLDEITFEIGGNIEKVTYGSTPSRDKESSWMKLVDGLYGTGTSIDENAYVAWEKKDNVEVVIEFKNAKYIDEVGYSGISISKFSVYNPNATYYVSMDGTTWTKVAEITGAAPSGTQSAAKESASAKLDNIVSAKYIKVVFDRYVENGVAKQWFFLDEITFNCCDLVENATIGTTPSRNAGASWEILFDGKYGEAKSHEELAYIGWADKDNVEIIAELSSVVGIKAVGYSGLVNPRMGVYRPDAVYYVSLDGQTWKEIGSIQPTGYKSEYDENVLYNYETAIEILTLDDVINAKYIKVVFSRDTDNVEEGMRRSEWYFLDEIEIECTNAVTIDKTNLSNMMNETSPLLTDLDSYTTVSANTLKDAYEFASEIYASELVSQSEVDDATAQLTLAKDNLVSIVSLENAIASAEAKLNETIYTKESADTLADAIEKAKALLTNGSESTIIEAITALSEAENALVERGDTTALSALIEEVELLNKEDYTEDSYAGLEEAIEAAKAIIDDENATQEKVDEAIENIKEAVEALEIRLVLDDLYDVADAYDALNKEDYTDASIENVEKVLDKIEEALMDEDTTQAEIDALTKELQSAIDALEERKAETSGVTNTGDSTNVGGLLAMMILALGVLFTSKKRKA